LVCSWIGPSSRGRKRYETPAFFAVVVRSPLTGTGLAIELTGNLSLLLANGQRVDQLRHLVKHRVLAQCQPAIPCLPHAGRIEQTVELVGEQAEHGQVWQILQQGAQILSLPRAKVFPARDDEKAVLEDEVRFVLAGERAAWAALAFARAAAFAAPSALALPCQLLPQSFDAVQDLLVDVLDDVENT
jgi:hypothetical protein